MKQIALKNFRKFIEFPGKEIESGMLDLNDITLLVGRNNAGKSTLVKALILIIENLKSVTSLPFSSDAVFSFRSRYNLHIETFSRALCNIADRSEITFKFRISNFYFEIDVQAADDIVLYNHIQKEFDTNAPITRILIDDEQLGIKLTIRPYYQSYDITFYRGSNDIEYNEGEDLVKVLKEEIADCKARLQTYTNPEDIASVNTRLKELRQRLRTVNTKTPKTEDISVSLTSCTLPYSGWTNYTSIANELFALSDLTYDNAQLVNLDQSRNKDFKYACEVIESHSDILRKCGYNLDAAISSIDIKYIYAHMASQESMLDTRDTDNLLAQVIEEYVAYTEKNDREEFVKKILLRWMDSDHFEIGSDFQIIPYPGHYYTMKVKDFNGKWVYISDLGMGSNQLLILLFSIANQIGSFRQETKIYSSVEDNDFPELLESLEFKRKVSTIIIEEPEQNLHPQIQSRLADFMLEMHETYGFRFLVETHSEYLIRKTQALVAKHRYKDEQDLITNNPFAVYYFDNDKIVYPMTYGIKGVFKNKFGGGFFDEASSLSFEVMKYGQR